jgi:hypothetical protein
MKEWIAYLACVFQFEPACLRSTWHTRSRLVWAVRSPRGYCGVRHVEPNLSIPKSMASLFESWEMWKMLQLRTKLEKLHE